MRAYLLRLKPVSRRLRCEMTDAEQRLWYHLRRKLQGVQFYRQKPLGTYVVDFFAPAVGLVVEIDGGQHFDAIAMDRDARRDAALARMELTVLRFDNLQVLRETEAVLEVLWRWVERRLLV